MKNTECKPEPMVFSSLKSQAVQAAFDGGAITSDAGALLLREVDRRIRQAWPNIQILVRAEERLLPREVHEMVRRKRRILPAGGLAQNPSLLRLAQPWTVLAEWHHRRTGQKV